MKKIIIGFVLLLLTFGNVFALSEAQQKIKDLTEGFTKSEIETFNNTSIPAPNGKDVITVSKASDSGHLSDNITGNSTNGALDVATSIMDSREIGKDGFERNIGNEIESETNANAGPGENDSRQSNEENKVETSTEGTDIGNAKEEGKASNTSSKIKDALIGATGNNNIVNNGTDDGFSSLSNILVWFKAELTAILSILVIGVFIFIGIRIVSSRGNPEEFKKAMLHFVYAVIGIFVFFIAWGAVKLISSLSI